MSPAGFRLTVSRFSKVLLYAVPERGAIPQTRQLSVRVSSFDQVTTDMLDTGCKRRPKAALQNTPASLGLMETTGKPTGVSIQEEPIIYVDAYVVTKGVAVGF
ncbi:hypothetical protein FRC12_009226 [Ceratobasidium sp. 428]|nr:hypothetical protein FRC09_001600 [Ceratobasidium sp. 395]KAG8762004.1 hypothetical protein FRC12_009226 [Ceratobasidium sp. 428]